MGQARRYQYKGRAWKAARGRSNYSCMTDERAGRGRCPAESSDASFRSTRVLRRPESPAGEEVVSRRPGARALGLLREDLDVRALGRLVVQEWLGDSESEKGEGPTKASAEVNTRLVLSSTRGDVRERSVRAPALVH